MKCHCTIAYSILTSGIATLRISILGRQKLEMLFWCGNVEGEPNIGINISFRGQVIRVLEESDNVDTPIPLTDLFGNLMAYRWLFLVEKFEQI